MITDRRGLWVHKKRERTVCQFCYILIVDFLRDYVLGLVSNIKQKVLSTPQGTECCQAPEEIYMTWRKRGSCPLRSLQSGGWQLSLRVEWTTKQFIKANASSSPAIVDWILLEWNLIKVRDKTKFGWECFQAPRVFNIHLNKQNWPHRQLKG